VGKRKARKGKKKTKVNCREQGWSNVCVKVGVVGAGEKVFRELRREKKASPH